MAPDVVSDRALNRATLARQNLLERQSASVLGTVERLVGLQAQEPGDPYVALWSRLARFDPQELSDLLEARAVVRIVVMRGTIHLVTAADCRRIRPLMQPVLDAELARHSEHAAAIAATDLEPVLAFARPRLRERPHTMATLRAAIAEEFPDLDAAALAYACRNRIALVQVPPRGLWGRRAQVSLMAAESWLGQPLDPAPSLDELVLRYFDAFGPAAVADVAAWSRLTGLRAAVERLRPKLREFRDERGRELFDRPDAPRPDPDTPAPPRFLPEYDNVLLSYADRSRFARADAGSRFAAAGRIRGTVLYDGLVAATWRVERHPPGASTLVVSHLGIAKRGLAHIAAEGQRLFGLLATDGPGTAEDVRLVALP